MVDRKFVKRAAKMAARLTKEAILLYLTHLQSAVTREANFFS